ncbi:MAG: 50S ribosomal protein L9 [Firmicutes bacterium]|nr:50S ribosomal protein L9 [Bacillota bacterium]
MKVILKQDVPRLGKQGDVVNVNDGYARNFLFPRQLAQEATVGSLKEVERQRKLQAAKEQRAEEEARSLAQRLTGSKVVVTARSGGGGRLFGSITNQDIAAAIKKQLKLTVDKRKIELKEPIKALGEYNVTLRLYTDVTSEIKVQVVPE